MRDLQGVADTLSFRWSRGSTCPGDFRITFTTRRRCRSKTLFPATASGNHPRSTCIWPRWRDTAIWIGLSGSSPEEMGVRRRQPRGRAGDSRLPAGGLRRDVLRDRPALGHRGQGEGDSQRPRRGPDRLRCPLPRLASAHRFIDPDVVHGLGRVPVLPRGRRHRSRPETRGIPAGQ